MFEGYYDPPTYRDMYHFLDGAQNDIFEDSVVTTPLPSSTGAMPLSSNTTSTQGVHDGPVNTPPSVDSTSAPGTEPTSPVHTPTPVPSPAHSGSSSSHHQHRPSKAHHHTADPCGSGDSYQ